MSIGRKYWDSFLKAMGEIALCFTAFSLIFPTIIQVQDLYLMLAVAIPIHLFSFFTFELRLFSRHLWVRRFIAIGFAVLIMIVMNLLFNDLRTDTKFLIAIGVLLVVYILLTVFIYYISDKIEQRNLEIINQRLADENKNQNCNKG